MSRRCLSDVFSVRTRHSNAICKSRCNCYKVLRYTIVTPGKSICDGVKNGTCVFTVGQNICVQVPVEFGAVAQVGDTYVSCNGATADDVCTDCNQGTIIPEEPKVEESIA